MASTLAEPFATAAMKFMKIFDASVLPAPDSPEMITHWVGEMREAG
jgi:hypothetical protein